MLLLECAENLSYLLRHSVDVRYDSEGFVRLSELMGAKHSIVKPVYPFKLAPSYLCQSKTTLSSVFFQFTA